MTPPRCNAQSGPNVEAVSIMFTSWRTKVKKVERLIAASKLAEAAHEASVCRLSNSRSGRATINRLAQALVNQAQRFSSMADFAGAWDNMTWASKIALQADQDRISKEKTRLVDQTVEHAQQLLEIGKPAQANRVASLLSSRQILDRRADDVRQICRALRLVEQLTAEGKLVEAAKMLDDMHRQHPPLGYLRTRADSLRQQHEELSSLHGELALAMNTARWDQVRYLSGRMLQISPNYQIAIDAIKRSQTAANQHSRSNTVPDRVAVLESSPGLSPPLGRQPTGNQPYKTPPITLDRDIIFVGDEPASVTDTRTFDQADTKVPRNTEVRSKLHKSSLDPPQIELSSISDIRQPELKPFLMWVDGVGGFWVCQDDRLTIGQESLGDKVDLPIQGDLGRDRIQICRIGDTYVLRPINRSNSGIRVDGKKVPDELLLGDEHLLEIAKAKLRFRRPHALSNSACLNLESRHRTVPWSDGILLMGSTLILGPDPSNHVICPDWNEQLVIFRRNGQLFCNSKGTLEVDGDINDGPRQLSTNSRISGADFAVTLEPIENL